jgi:predicted RNase H-like HicB family nuclease/predicted transcriptional regulator
MVALTTYHVVYELDPDGLWVADAPDLRGAHTQGRTLAVARERVREVIALVEDIADESDILLNEEVRIRPDVAEKVAEARDLRLAADQLAAFVQAAYQHAAEALRDIHISTRDAGELLGLSHGRVHQLLTEERARVDAELEHTMKVVREQVRDTARQLEALVEETRRVAKESRRKAGVFRSKADAVRSAGTKARASGGGSLVIKGSAKGQSPVAKEGARKASAARKKVRS